MKKKKKGKRYGATMGFGSSPYSGQVRYDNVSDKVNILVTADDKKPVWTDLSPERLYKIVAKLQRKDRERRGEE